MQTRRSFARCVYKRRAGLWDPKGSMGGTGRKQKTTSSSFLASVHKCLRFCDLCEELAFGTSTRKSVKLLFIQLVRVQRVVPPVPGESGSVGERCRRTTARVGFITEVHGFNKTVVQSKDMQDLAVRKNVRVGAP